MLSAALMNSGMQFQMTGPATEKALSVNMIIVSKITFFSIIGFDIMAASVQMPKWGNLEVGN